MPSRARYSASAASGFGIPLGSWIRPSAASTIISCNVDLMADLRASRRPVVAGMVVFEELPIRINICHRWESTGSTWKRNGNPFLYPSAGVTVWVVPENAPMSPPFCDRSRRTVIRSASEVGVTTKAAPLSHGKLHCIDCNCIVFENERSVYKLSVGGVRLAGGRSERFIFISLLVVFCDEPLRIVGMIRANQEA